MAGLLIKRLDRQNSYIPLVKALETEKQRHRMKHQQKGIALELEETQSEMMSG